MPKCNASVRIEYNDFTTPLYQLLHLVPLFLFQWAILSLFFVYFRSFHKKFNQLMWKYVSPASSLGFKLTTSCTSVFSQNHSLSPVLDSNSQPLATSVFSQDHSTTLSSLSLYHFPTFILRPFTFPPKSLAFCVKSFFYLAALLKKTFFCFSSRWRGPGSVNGSGFVRRREDGLRLQRIATRSQMPKHEQDQRNHQSDKVS